LQARDDYTSREDHVFCSRLSRRLDPSAVRRRFKTARDAAGLRPLRFHALRHAAGSLIARHADARFVQEFLGHSRITTTERYMHAKARPEDLERVKSGVRGEIIQRPRVVAVQSCDRSVAARRTLEARYPQPLRWLGARLAQRRASAFLFRYLTPSRGRGSKKRSQTQ
jgi:hypothetical protein